MKDGTFHESGIIPESETITYGQTKRVAKEREEKQTKGRKS